MKKILIIGPSGAGKSTFAKKLATKTNLELIHLDQHYWKSNWVEPSKAAWATTVQQLLQKESWIMDGNYSGTFNLRIPHADTIIYLDIPRWKCLYRATKRILTHWRRTRPDMGAGCPERFDWAFYQYIWNYPKKKRPGVLRLLDELKNEKAVYILRSDREIEEFLVHESQNNEFLHYSD